jgi:hypothetical protein
MKRGKKVTKSKKKKRSLSLRAWLLLGGLIFVIVSSLFLNSTIMTWFSRASDSIDYSPTMKQKKLNFNVDPTGTVQEDTPVPNTPRPGQPTSRPANATVTPKPVPTTGEAPMCKLDNLMNPPNCKCPDLQGLKCVGEETQGIGNYYYKPLNQPDYANTDTEGQYIGVKGRWVYRYSNADYAKKKAQSNCTEWCIGKPVIYLYPTEPTLIDVQVFAPGRVFVSDPLYPEGGWKNVLAQPNGNLTYEGKQYRELFYETELTTDLKIPANGILIARGNLLTDLTKYTKALGLNDFESKEFTDYWVPLLKDMNSPYVLFSILDVEEKERIDRVEISPEPDTFIGFIAYFKPVYEKYSPTPLELPEVPPARIGYTAVEWGGTIDNGAIR